MVRAIHPTWTSPSIQHGRRRPSNMDATVHTGCLIIFLFSSSWVVTPIFFQSRSRGPARGFAQPRRLQPAESSHSDRKAAATMSAAMNLSLSPKLRRLASSHRHMKTRGLRQLAEAGTISIEQQGKRAPLVTYLLEHPQSARV